MIHKSRRLEMIQERIIDQAQKARPSSHRWLSCSMLEICWFLECSPTRADAVYLPQQRCMMYGFPHEALQSLVCGLDNHDIACVSHVASASLFMGSLNGSLCPSRNVPHIATSFYAQVAIAHNKAQRIIRRRSQSVPQQKLLRDSDCGE